MARGIDTCAHRGVINAKAGRLPVFGTGVDVIYPKRTRSYQRTSWRWASADQRIRHGTFAAPQNFPIRNRIISGLSIGVLVVEAGSTSGTRITSRCALEQNRELFAVRERHQQDFVGRLTR